MRTRINTRVQRQLFDWQSCCQRAGMYDHILVLVSPKAAVLRVRPHAHAQVSSRIGVHPVERFRLHVKGMVGSSGWLDGFPEVGRRRGPWRRRWAKDLLDASATGKNNSLRHGAACAKTMQKPQSRGDVAIAMNRWLEILRSGADVPIVAPTSNRRSPRFCLSEAYRPVHRKAARLGDSRWTQVMRSLLRRRP